MKNQPNQTGRPSIFSVEIAEELLAQLMEGMSLRKICKAESMPSLRTVLNWLSDPDNEEFRDRYAYAREIQGDVLADEIVDIADEATDKDNANAIKVRVDARKWVASKLRPKKYGNFQAIEVSGSMESSPPDLSQLSEQELELYIALEEKVRRG